MVEGEDKLEGEELRRHARSESGELLGVRIQPYLPEGHSDLDIVEGGKKVSVVSVVSLAEDWEETRDRVGARLRELLGREAPWVEFACAFAAEVTPEQLRQIVALPEIEVVVPGPKHRPR